MLFVDEIFQEHKTFNHADFTVSDTSNNTMKMYILQGNSSASNKLYFNIVQYKKMIQPSILCRTDGDL